MADRALPDLVGRARLDTSQLKRGAAEARAEVASIGGAGTKAGSILEGSFSKSSKAITGRLGSMGAHAQGVLDNIGSSAFKSGNLLQTALGGGALVAAVGIGALAAKGIGEFGKLADQIRGLQRVTGASAEDASKLAAGLRAVGIDSETAQKGFFLLSKTIETSPQKLAAVNVEVERNSKGNVDLFGTLENVAEAYQKAGKGQEGNAIAAAAFGKSGQALLPILGKTREELEAISKTAGLRGLILDQGQLDSALKFKLAMRDLGESVKGVEIALGQGLVPVLANFARGATTVIDFGNRISQSVGGIGGVVKGLTEAAIPGLGILDALGGKNKDAGAAAEAHAMSEEELTSALEEGAKKADEEAKALDRLLNAQVSLVDATLGLQGSQDALARSQQAAREKQDALTAAIKEHGPKSAEAAAASRDLTEANHGLEEAASRVAHNVADQAEQQALANGHTFTAAEKTASYKQALVDVANQIGGPTGEALRILAQQIKDLPDAKQIAVTTPGIESAIANIDRLNTAMDRAAARGSTVKSRTLNVPERMAGGPVAAGQPYIVGERRRELFIPDVSGVILPSVPRGSDGAAARHFPSTSPTVSAAAWDEAAFVRALVRAMEHVSVNMDSQSVGQVSRSRRRAFS